MEYDSVPGDYQYRALERKKGMQSFWHHGKVHLLQSIEFVRPGDRVLEAGCGSGNLGFSVAPTASAVTLIDFASPAVEFCRRLREERRLENVTVRECALDDMNFPDNSFDKIILADVIEHLEEPNRTLSAFHRFLKPGGALFVTTPNYHSLWPAVEWIIDRFQLTPPMRGEQHITFFDPRSLNSMMQTMGFREVKICSFYFLAPFLATLSWNLARRCLNFELGHRIPYGMLLYAIGKK